MSTNIPDVLLAVTEFLDNSFSENINSINGFPEVVETDNDLHVITSLLGVSPVERSKIKVGPRPGTGETWVDLVLSALVVGRLSSVENAYVSTLGLASNISGKISRLDLKAGIAGYLPTAEFIGIDPVSIPRRPAFDVQFAVSARIGQSDFERALLPDPPPRIVERTNTYLWPNGIKSVMLTFEHKKEVLETYAIDV